MVAFPALINPVVNIDSNFETTVSPPLVLKKWIEESDSFGEKCNNFCLPGTADFKKSKFRYSLKFLFPVQMRTVVYTRHSCFSKNFFYFMYGYTFEEENTGKV